MAYANPCVLLETVSGATAGRTGLMGFVLLSGFGVHGGPVEKQAGDGNWAKQDY